MPAILGVSAAVRLLVPALGALALAVALLTLVTPSADGTRHHATRWDCLSHYESTHRWHVNTGNGHYGGLQFSRSTWAYYGGPSYSGNYWPHKATKAEQIVIAKRVAFKGWKGRKPQGGRSAWPNTWPKC
jgi:hypothetical protein